MFPPSLGRAVFNATAFALTFASWAVWNVSIWNVFAPLDGAFERRAVAESLSVAFLVGGVLSLVANRLLSRFSSNAAIAILATVATLGSVVAHSSLDADAFRRVPALVGVGLVGVGFFSLVGRLYARTLRDLSRPSRFPAIFVFASLGCIASQVFLRYRSENCFAISATFTALLAVLALVGPRSDDEAERAAPSPSYLSLVRRNPLFWATVFVASCFGASVWTPTFSRVLPFFPSIFEDSGSYSSPLFPVLSAVSELVALLAAPSAIRLCGGLKRSLGVAIFASALSYAALNGSVLASLGGLFLQKLAYVGVVAVVPALYVERFYPAEARRSAQTLLTVATLVLPAFATSAILNVVARTALETNAPPIWELTALPTSILAFLAIFWLRRGAPIPASSPAADAAKDAT
ncbi:MAG: hypothetical protein IJO46_09410 [Thermoguttaceae bacterium]|nr:hypothetical protein [Thermoguttaceae bacterium]